MFYARTGGLLIDLTELREGFLEYGDMTLRGDFWIYAGLTLRVTSLRYACLTLRRAVLRLHVRTYEGRFCDMLV